MDVAQLVEYLASMLEDLNSTPSTNNKQTTLSGSQEDKTVKALCVVIHPLYLIKQFMS